MQILLDLPAKNQGCDSKYGQNLMTACFTAIDFMWPPIPNLAQEQVTDDSVNFPTSAQTVILMPVRFHFESHQLQLVWVWPDLVTIGMSDPAVSIRVI